MFVFGLDGRAKFTSKRSDGRIEVGSRTVEGERIFFVSDNGAGFNMAEASKLFELFKRLHASDDFEGTGIGLATVQRVIARHGGRIWADSVAGQGATFSFTLEGPRGDRRRGEGTHGAIVT